jgi:hypothetical protein
MIKINLDKAKAIFANSIRTQRDAKLAQLDVEFMRALEGTDRKKKDNIIAQKQTLRDLPLKINDVKTLEELQALQFPELE